MRQFYKKKKKSLSRQPKLICFKKPKVSQDRERNGQYQMKKRKLGDMGFTNTEALGAVPSPAGEHRACDADRPQQEMSRISQVWESISCPKLGYLALRLVARKLKQTHKFSCPDSLSDCGQPLAVTNATEILTSASTRQVPLLTAGCTRLALRHSLRYLLPTIREENIAYNSGGKHCLYI